MEIVYGNGYDFYTFMVNRVFRLRRIDHLVASQSGYRLRKVTCQKVQEIFIKYGCKENATYGKANAVRKHPSKGYVKTY
jgi:hypothetical protein